MKKNPQKRFALLLVIVLAVAIGPEIVKNLNTVNKTTEEMSIHQNLLLNLQQLLLQQ